MIKRAQAKSNWQSDPNLNYGGGGENATTAIFNRRSFSGGKGSRCLHAENQAKH